MSVSKHFIPDDNVYAENLDYSVFDELGVKETKPLDTFTKFSVYKLGQEINNGIRFFGQIKKGKRKGEHTSAVCICPVCNEI